MHHDRNLRLLGRLTLRSFLTTLQPPHMQALSVNMLKKLISNFKKSEAVIPSSDIKEEVTPINITRYGDTQGLSQWELMYEGIQLVILKHNSPSPQRKNLLAFKPYGDLIWELEPHTKQEHDCIKGRGSSLAFCLKLTRQVPVPAFT